MKKYTVLIVVVSLFAILLCGGCAAVLTNVLPSMFWVPLAVLGCLIMGYLVILFRFRSVCTGWIQRLCKKIDPQNQSALDKFPLPLLLVDDKGKVLFANKLFVKQVMNGETPIVDTPLTALFEDVTLTEITVNMTVDLCRNGRRFTAYTSVLRGEKGQQYLLYLTDDTELKIAAEEYDASRPVVMQICIDNLDEATDHLRAGDRSRIAGTIEVMLEDWIAADGGVLQKYANDRFMAVTEHRYLSAMTEDRFSILARIRQAFPEAEGNITLSIGIGEGKTVEEGRHFALRALDMALSRGGDQVAVKTVNGYDFYGGQSRGIEHRSRVRSRIIADALRELILAGDRVLVMGHRISDLDCIGSGVALVALARSLKIPASVIVDRSTTMADQLIRTYEDAGHGDWFMTPAAAEKAITKRTLLIVVDTHSAPMLEAPSVYEMAERVVVIDHHRRKVDYIDNALLTYHEPNASSASELIAELLPYLSTESCGRLEAEALLSGITLDTRNFVLRTGVRTFEAAAYLRSLGADTVTVKKFFNENLNIHQLKNELVGRANLYRDTAIAVSHEDLVDRRVAVAQAADDLLSVKGVKASFVIATIGNSVYISARSFGEMNVQLIMESLGGGGHHTMAATQLTTDVTQAEEALRAAIDRYYEEQK